MKRKTKIKLIIAILISSFFYLNNSFVLANNLFKAQLIPNDPDLINQYYLGQVSVVSAWEKLTESEDVVVAVIDTGVDIYHPELASNIWQNTDEIRGDKIDNDNNGYIDDYQGWDFILNTSDPRPKFGGSTSPLGINHGTIVSGVIGAVGNNNIGIAGVSWKIKIMPLRALDNQGSGNVPTVVEAINYAIDNGADIINLSIVGNFSDIFLENAIKRAYQNGVMIMSAAGNESSPNEVSDLAISPRYPICYDGDENYVFGVGSVDYNDVISSFSNYGSCIDVMAPGEGFYSTRVYEPVFPDYQTLTGGYWSGTSVATPLVSATAAMIKSLRPELINQEIYDIIKQSADSIDEINSDYIGDLGGGRLNVNQAILLAEEYVVNNKDFVIAPASDHSPLIKIVNINGIARSEFMAYSENFTGGVNVAKADIDGDGIKEIITAAGNGGGPHIKIFNRQGELLKQFMAYSENFTGGVNITVADIDDDGEIEIITSPQSAYKPEVKIFNIDGILKASKIVFSDYYLGGVNLAVSDINADGIPEIIVSQNDVGSLVKIFDGSFVEFLNFEAFPGLSVKGVKISAINLYGDSRTEFLVVPVKDYKPQLRIFSPSGNLENQWLAFNEDDNFGLNISSGDIDEDGIVDIVISQNKDNNSIKIFGYKGDLKNQFFAYEDSFVGGINVNY